MSHARRELLLTSRERAALDAQIAVAMGLDLPEDLVRTKVIEALKQIDGLRPENHSVAEILVWLRMRRMPVHRDLHGSIQRIHAWHEMQGSGAPAVDVLAAELRAANPDASDPDIKVAIIAYQAFR